MPPHEEYRTRLDRWRKEHARQDRAYRRLGNARLAVGIAALLIAAAALGGGWISSWWLLLPVAVFVALASAHQRVDTALRAALRATVYYERALARVENRWIGTGRQGEEFRSARHLYADDLDLFGRGSLFELLSTARTATGERVLAEWLLAPGEPAAVAARQQAVRELRPRIDLREDLALLGDDIRAAVDDRKLAEWGSQPPVRFFPAARIAGFALAAAAALTLAAMLLPWFTIRPFLLVVLAELAFAMAIRDPMRRVVEAYDAPARELGLLALLLDRLEREAASSPALERLHEQMQVGGLSATAQIRRLRGMVEKMDWAQNQFFRLLSSPLLWIPQFAMAIESWRAQCGPHIGRWVAAVGEFEALGSLACFAYERPEAVFPELLQDSEPRFEAEALAHPLIPPDEAVANDVTLGGATRLWIISGSNMSGKSTLLRAAGLSVALAWAGAPVTAARLRLSRLSVAASLRPNDSLADHRSRFYAEISRLKDIVDLAGGGRQVLFLLDELLSGTNSHDRRIGAEALLRGLVERGAIGLATTHDLALAEIADDLGPRAVNVHFEDHLEGGEIRFDYRLRPGVVARGNALELMRAVGLAV
jgi:MutS domain V